MQHKGRMRSSGKFSNKCTSPSKPFTYRVVYTCAWSQVGSEAREQRMPFGMGDHWFKSALSRTSSASLHVPAFTLAFQFCLTPTYHVTTVNPPEDGERGRRCTRYFNGKTQTHTLLNRAQVYSHKQRVHLYRTNIHQHIFRCPSVTSQFSSSQYNENLFQCTLFIYLRAFAPRGSLHWRFVHLCVLFPLHERRSRTFIVRRFAASCDTLRGNDSNQLNCIFQ